MKKPLTSGVVSMIISIVITYIYHIAIHASEDIGWALVAVAIASFLSAFFTLYDN